MTVKIFDYFLSNSQLKLYHLYYRYCYIRELFNSRTKISVAPTSWSASIFSDTSFLRISTDTALSLPHSRLVTVGDFFPGVMAIAS
mmetsp:Transcript_32458/g.36856  ORF Transcript_32458/g.36856 Transcript_32458/m.36856 type:complete len:86 (-) Transcript_32458:787-1044(-)